MLSTQSELSSQQMPTGRSPVISFLRCQQAEVCSFVSLLQRYSILRFAAAKKLGAGFARASFPQPGAARKTFVAWQQCLCNFGAKKFRTDFGGRAVSAF